MTKEIAFYIWLTDKEIELYLEGDAFVASYLGEAKEKFAELYGINEMIAEQFRLPNHE